jgi:cytochrome P450
MKLLNAVNARSGKMWLLASAVGMVGAAVLAERKRSKPSRSRAGVMPKAEAGLPKASIRDTLFLMMEVFIPTIAKGVIIRRPAMVDMAERLDLDRRAIRRMQRLRRKYGDGPLLLRLPLRSQAVVLAPEHVHRVLEQSPDPFDPASSEKRAALSHLEPKGALISHGEDRADRRRFNEQVLEVNNPVHHLADHFLPVVEEEAAHIMAAAQQRGELGWNEFSQGWFRMVRRVVFGDGARDDEELSRMTADLRRVANWAFLHPQKKQLRERFLAHLKALLERAEPGSLSAVAAQRYQTARTMPHHQVPQWLFAFDPAGMATFRALALIATHPEQAVMVQEEIRSHEGGAHYNLPLLRATVLESLRLWPTTPLVLRQTTRHTEWENGTMPARTGVAIFAPYFHRDDERRVYADRFTPELWLKERTDKDWPLIPFSGGPVICPARNLVQLITSSMLAALLRSHQFRLEPPDRLEPARLPATLNHYSLRFSFRER